MDDIGLDMMRLKQKGYCCAQIMIITALEVQKKKDALLVRAAGGLCFGIGMSEEICGSFAGGACLIALYAGKGADDERMDERFPVMMNELADWFKEAIGGTYGGIRCEDILSLYPDKSVCGSIVLATYAKTIDILDSHGMYLPGRFDTAFAEE